MRKHGVVGNLNIDLTVILNDFPAPDTSVKASSLIMGPGGGAVNYSVAVARFGHKPFLFGITTKLYVKLGMLDTLIKEGVDTSNIIMLNKSEMPGIAIMIQIPGEQRRMISFRGVNAKLNQDLALELVRKAPKLDLVHAASVPPAVVEKLAMFLREESSDTLLTYDPGSETKTHASTIKNVIDKVDILFLNEAEYNIVFGSTNKTPWDIVRENKITLVIKQGREGGTVYNEREHYKAIPPAIKVVDTTGAGDVFNAYFNSCVLEGKSLKESLKYAVAAGALKAMRKGSTSAPRREEVESILDNVKVM